MLPMTTAAKRPLRDNAVLSRATGRKPRAFRHPSRCCGRALSHRCTFAGVLSRRPAHVQPSERQRGGSMRRVVARRRGHPGSGDQLVGRQALFSRIVDTRPDGSMIAVRRLWVMVPSFSRITLMPNCAGDRRASSAVASARRSVGLTAACARSVSSRSNFDRS